MIYLYLVIHRLFGLTLIQIHAVSGGFRRRHASDVVSQWLAGRLRGFLVIKTRCSLCTYVFGVKPGYNLNS